MNMDTSLEVTGLDPKIEDTRRDWQFRVVGPKLHKYESVCVTGDCEELGNWAPDKVIILKKEEHSDNWSIVVNLPLTRDVMFRYCICLVDETLSRVDVRQWETNIKPRLIKRNSLIRPEVADIFGNYDQVQKVDRGWLNSQTLLQLKFFRNPFIFKSKAVDGTLSIKLTPITLQFYSHCEDPTIDLDTIEEGQRGVLTEVATLNNVNSAFRQQHKFGRIYNSDDFLIFNTTATDHSTLAYVVDFYKHGSPTSTDNPVHIGHSYILPDAMKQSEGCFQVPITCSDKPRPLGSMKVEYLVVRPMPESLCNLKVSYCSHWKKTWKGLDVGHRGLGATFKSKTGITIRENTLASLKSAAANGADFVEFDVQLSKDLVPVVYHDFHVSVALKKKKQIEYTEMLELPMKDLTYDQLQKLKVYHVVEGRSNEPRFFDEDLEDHQPFPLLFDVLRTVDPSVGLNVEVKWTMELEDGSFELEHPFDLNLYIDKILDVILRSNVSHNLFFSCFHPDVCTVLRMKQNIYPVMFLTQGVTKKYPNYHDLRCKSIQSAVQHSLNANLLGIVVHTEDLLRDSTQVQFVLDAGLVIFCWGDDNNNKDTIKHLKELGLHGVIFDKIDQYSTKEVKESIFLMESKEAEKNTTVEVGGGDY